MKSIIWKIELAAAVLLAVSALVWGLRPGVWNYGGFYRMAAGEQSRTYTRPGCSTVEVTEDNRLRIQSPAGQTAEFTLSLAENGSYRAAEMAMDGVVRNVTEERLRDARPDDDTEDEPCPEIYQHLFRLP